MSRLRTCARQSLVGALLLLVIPTSRVHARTAEPPRIIQGGDVAEYPGVADAGLAVAASTDTFTFGPYGFENGWDGWTSVDLALDPEVYVHRVDVATIPGGLGYGTTFSPGQQVWFGTLGANACGAKACFPGYADNTDQLLFKSYAIPSGTSSLSFHYRSDTDLYDYTYVIVSRAGCPTLLPNGSYELPGDEFEDRDILTTYSGQVGGVETLDLSAYAGTTVCIIFRSVSDGIYSDGDCRFDSSDGMFEIDDIAVTGGLTSTFESGDDGWTMGRTAGVGSFAALEPLSSLPMLDPCPTYCGLSGTVVTIYDPTDPYFHPENQLELVVSPVFDLTANPASPVGSYVLQFDVYANLPLANADFYFWKVRYSPLEVADCSCVDPNDWSEWMDEGTFYFGGGTPTCTSGLQFNVSARIPGHATRAQIGVGALNYPPFLTVPGGNQSPYFDNISLRGATLSAPAIVHSPWDYLQDAYPNAATFALAKSTPVKVDCALNIDPGRNETRLGDSLITTVPLSCNADQHVEVDVLFKAIPGPCAPLTHPWWVAYNAHTKIVGGAYDGFAIARCDTAISATNPNAWSGSTGVFMGRFHERPVGQDEDGSFQAHTYAGLGDWSSFTGGVEGQSIFPDDVFTPGSIIYYVTHASYLPVRSNGDAYDPSPQFGNGDGDRIGALEGNQKWASQGGPYSPSNTFVRVWNALPRTTTDGTTDCANAAPAHCFLYVDRWSDRGPQYAITNAFRNLQIGWDQFNVEAPSSNMGNSLGTRYTPSNYANGNHAPGPLPSLLNEVYTAILWNTGSNNTSNFSRGATTTNANDAGNDVNLLDAWLRNNPTTSTTKYLWVSGDGNARFLNAPGNRLQLLNWTLGATFAGHQYRDVNTAWGITLTGLGPECTSGLTYGLRGNWCPQRRSYNVVATSSTSTGTTTLNWKYPDVNSVVYGAGVQTVAGGTYNFRTQLDAWSLENLRAPNPVMGQETNRQVTEWVARSLSICFTGCFGLLTTVGVDEDAGGAFVNALVPLQNPLPAEPVTRITFTLARRGRATVRVYDAGGRVVSTAFDGMAEAGENAVPWRPGGLRGGVYFYEVETEGFRSARKIVLAR